MSYADRVLERRKTFKCKVDVDEARRRCEDDTVQIRKKEKDDHIARRRRLVELSSDIAGVQVCLTNLPISVESVPQLVSYLKADDALVVTEAVVAIRKILSMDRNPPIQTVLDAGILPVLKTFLEGDYSPTIQLEACWAISNMASGTPAQAEAVVSSGVVPLFIKLLRSPDLTLQEQAVWAIANISGDRVEYRDGCLSVGVLGAICGIMSRAVSDLDAKTIENTTLPVTRLSVWAFSNLCRGVPRPAFEIMAPSIPIVGRVFSKFSDTEILSDLCWAISYLTDGAERSVVLDILGNLDINKLVSLLGHPSSDVSIPALRTVGNLVSGDSEVTRMVVSSAGHLLMMNLKSSLLSFKKSVRKECLWTLSNVIADSQENVQLVLDSGVMATICDTLRSSSSVNSTDIRMEGFWCVCNACMIGTANQVSLLVNDTKYFALALLVEFLKTYRASEFKLIIIALEAVHAVLAIGAEQYGKRSVYGNENKPRNEANHDTSNKFAILFEELDGLSVVEDLQDSPCDEVYHASVRILESFYDCHEGDSWKEVGVTPPIYNFSNVLAPSRSG